MPLDANPATAHMFIIKPFSAGGLISMFSTHPPTEQRIQALMNLGELVGRCSSPTVLVVVARRVSSSGDFFSGVPSSRPDTAYFFWSIFTIPRTSRA